MKTRPWMLPVAAALALTAAALLGPAAAYSSDPPHWTSPSGYVDIQCAKGCHQLHLAPGGQLTAAAGNANLCQSCHNPSLGAAAEKLPILTGDKAVPGVGGTSHAFDVAAINALYGAALPQDTQMQVRVMGGNVVCSTCHNQHAATAATAGTPRISAARMASPTLGSKGTVASGGTYSGPAGVWYLIQIDTAGATGTAQFRWSLDGGTSWKATGVATAASVSLDYPTGCAPNCATVAFTNGTPFDQSFLVGERWEFSASYPFLRKKLDSGDNASGDKFCRDCHREWVMTHTEVGIWNGAYKSHPVGVGLNANAKGYDRAVPLDGNGQEQTGGTTDRDGNPTNNLKLDAGRVQCLTCHGVHNVDGNTTTVDRPQ